MNVPGYRIVDEIARGGMAVVYLAVQEASGASVAIKRLSPSLTSEPQFAKRFVKEVQILSCLDHPNVVPVYESGFAGDTPYIVMAYLPGGDLRSRLEVRPDRAFTLSVVRQVGRALAYAHSFGLVHRDIKPENILFDREGRAVLADFGIAKNLHGDTRLTRAGACLGTPQYMSPEQVRGAGVDARSDLYSLGIVLFEMLTGRLPFDGDDPFAVGIRHLCEKVPKLEGESPRLQKLVSRLLAKQVGRRPGSAQELIEALDTLNASHGTGNAAVANKAPRTRLGLPPSLLWGAGGAGCAALALVGLLLLVQGPSRSQLAGGGGGGSGRPPAGAPPSGKNSGGATSTALSRLTGAAPPAPKAERPADESFVPAPGQSTPPARGMPVWAAHSLAGGRIPAGAAGEFWGCGSGYPPCLVIWDRELDLEAAAPASLPGDLQARAYWVALDDIDW